VGPTDSGWREGLAIERRPTVLEYGSFVALGLLIIWAVLLLPLNRGTLKPIPFGVASMFLALMIPFFWLGPEITELTISKVGSFKTNAEQATKYFDEIKTIRKKVEGQERAINDAVELLNKKIGDQSATVDQVAKTASAAEQLSKEAEEQINQARKSLADVNSAITEAKASLEKVQAIASLTELVADAQNDNRSAFDELKKLASDPNNPLAQKADDAWRSITNSFISAIQLGYPVNWSPGIDPSKLTLWDLERGYNDAQNQIIKIGILQYIWDKPDIQKVDKLDLLLKVARQDRSLKNVVYALRTFAKETSANVPVTLDVDYAENWWEEHRQEFVNK
jgi:hypothetical protein